MLATKHSASSVETLMPDICRAEWNNEMGIRVAFCDTTQLKHRWRCKISVRASASIHRRQPRMEWTTYTLLNSPRMHSSRAFSSVSNRLSSTSRRSYFSNAASKDEMSPLWIAVMNGE